MKDRAGKCGKIEGMGTQVTLTLPDSLYKQVEIAAQRASRPIADVLVDVVIDAFTTTVYEHPQRGQMEQEQAAYARRRKELLLKYEGQYIAMHGGVVVDHDRDVSTLTQRIDDRYSLDEVVHIRLVTREPDRVLRSRSLRFVD